MYNDVAKIYVGDVKDLQGEEFWNEVQNRLSYANDNNPVVDTFYLRIIKDEMECFSDFTTYDYDYIVYMEETTDKKPTEPLILFTKEDLDNYKSETKHRRKNETKQEKPTLEYTYIER